MNLLYIFTQVLSLKIFKLLYACHIVCCNTRARKWPLVTISHVWRPVFINDHYYYLLGLYRAEYSVPSSITLSNEHGVNSYWMYIVHECIKEKKIFAF